MVIASIAGLITGGMFVGCLAVVEWATQHYADEIAAMPLDEEVKAAEEASAIEKAKYLRATAWKHVPTLYRIFLVAGASMMVASCFLFAFQGSSCFVSVKVSMDVYAVPLCGSLFNLVKPLGYVGMALQLGGCLCLFAFKKWASAHLETYVDEGEPPSQNSNLDTQSAIESAGTGAAADYTPPVIDQTFDVVNPAHGASRPVEPSRAPPSAAPKTVPQITEAVEETEV